MEMIKSKSKVFVTKHSRKSIAFKDTIPEQTRKRFKTLGIRKTGIITTFRLIVIIYCVALIFGHLLILSREDLSRVFNTDHTYVTVAFLAVPIALHKFGIIRLNSVSNSNGGRTNIAFIDYYIADDGLFGRRGPYYDTILLMMACFEFPVHTYQGYLVSNTVIHSEYALAYGIIIGFDCAINPALVWYFHQESSKMSMKLLKRRSYFVLLDLFQDMTLAVFVPTLLIYQSIFQLEEGGSWISYPNILTEAYSIAQHVAIMSPIDMIVTVGPLMTAHFQFETLVDNWLDIAAIEEKNHKEETKSNVSRSADTFGSLKEHLNLSKIAQAIKNVTYLDILNRRIQIFATIISLSYGFALIFISVTAYTKAHDIRCDSMIISREHCTQTISSWDIFSDNCNCFSMTVDCRPFDSASNLENDELIDTVLEQDLNPTTMHYLEISASTASTV